MAGTFAGLAEGDAIYPGGQDVTISYLNGDGNSDLYLRNQETGEVCYYYMNGTTVLTEEITGTASDYVQ